MTATRKLLIAVGQPASDPAQVPFGVRALIEGADEVMVLVPSLPRRFEWVASATDDATERADERLHAVLGQLDELGADGEGRVGADDPLVALEDAIREFAPDHLLIALRGRDRAGWQERGLLDQIQERFHLPMTVFQLADVAG